MGKVRKQRRKLHLESKTSIFSEPSLQSTTRNDSTISTAPLLEPQDNLFEGVQIDVNLLNKNISNDTRSVKSFKSMKSESGKSLTKKNKLKLRREMLLKKFQVLNEKKMTAKRKRTPIVGDMNPLHDALPSLSSLLKSRADISYKQNLPQKKPKGIEKAKTLRKKQLQGIQIFQNISRNKIYQKDPKLAISQHVKGLLDCEKKS